MSDEQQGNDSGSKSVEIQQAMMNERNSEFLRYLVDNDPLIEDIYHRLNGEVWNPSMEKWWKFKRSMMNENGIFELITQLKFFTDKLFATTNYTSEEIERDCEEFEHALIDNFYAHSEEYELNYVADMTLLLNMASHVVYATRKKSQGAGFFRGLSKSTQHTEVVNDRNNQGSSGGMANKYHRFLDRIGI
jgi:hypothetical protein